MNRLIGTIWTPVGKKIIMALTGLCFCGFLCVHLLGNLTLYLGKDIFNSYAEHLHSLGPLLHVAEIGLLLLFACHVFTGVILFIRNLWARPVRYKVNKSAGARTIGSSTMPYTGILILLFIIVHLLNLHFVDKSLADPYTLVERTLTNPLFAALYFVAMIIAAVHVSHGVWSAFQTLGAGSPRYMPAITKVGLVFSIAIGFGFGLIPVYFLFVL
jgi:succinate dehydrogenase / fumarate reductase cytochrome b subunit